MLDTNEVIKELSDLFKLDYDTVQSFEAAVEKAGEDEIRARLEDFRSDHERHLDNLESMIDPHRLIDKTILPHALFKDVAGLRKSEALLKEKFIDSLAPLLGYDLAEVIVLSYRGILDDRPSVETLEKRTETLVNSLIIKPD